MTEHPCDLTVTRVLQARRSDLWNAWEDPTLFVQWFTAAPTVTISKCHELYPGGSFEIAIRQEDGTEHPGNACILEVVANRRMVMTDALSKGWRPSETVFHTMMFDFEDEEGGTRLTVTAMHKNEDDRRKHEEMGFFDMWNGAIASLGEFAHKHFNND